MKLLDFFKRRIAGDPAMQLAIFAKQNGWTPTDLWNAYDNFKHKLDREEQHRFYNTVSRACAILAWGNG